MQKITPTFQAVHRQLAQESSKDFACPIFVSIIIQVFSHLHSFSALFISAFPFASYRVYKILPALKDIISLTLVFPYFDIFRTNKITAIVWCIIVLYTICHFITSAAAVYLAYKGKPAKGWVAKARTIGLLVHCRIVYFPILYFLFQFVKKFSDCPSGATHEFECRPARFAIVIVMIIFNTVIAINKEFWFYNIIKGKSTYSCKTNIVAQILLVQKIITALFYIFFPDSLAATRTSSILNLSIFVLLSFLIYYKLPFYELTLNRISVIFSAISFVMSVFFLLKACGILDDTPKIELVIYLTSSMVIAIFLKILNTILYKILRFEYSSPEQAIHLPILIKRATALYSPFPRLHAKFDPVIICYYGLLKSQGIDTMKMQNPKNFEEFETELYTAIVDKFNILIKKYPHCELLRFSTAQIYMEKLGAAPRAVSLLRYISSRASTTPMKISVEFALQRLEYVYKNASVEGEEVINSMNYFKCRDTAVQMQESIKEELDKHSEFWKELTREKVDVHKMINLGQKIDGLYSKIQKIWDNNTATFKYFGAPILMYGVYLDTVRDLPHEGWPIIYKYFNLRKTKGNLAENKLAFNMFAETTAILVGCIEPERMGKITDASASVKGLFNIDKEALIGQKVDVLMPQFIATRHDGFIHKYNKSSSHQLNTNMKTLVRTVEGEFFESELSLRVYPFMKSGVNIMAFVKKVANREPTIIVGDDEVLVDCSKDIEGILHIYRNQLNSLHIGNICNELESVCAAFNVAYGTPRSNGEEKVHHMISNRDLSCAEKYLSEDGASQYYFDMEGGPGGEDRLLLNKVDDSEILLSPKYIKPRRRGSGGLVTVRTTTGQNLLTSPMSPLTSARIPLGSNRAFYNFDYAQRAMMANATDKESAMELCKKYKDGVKLKLLPVGNGTGKTPTHIDRGHYYYVKIEPLTIAGKFYKVLKLKKSSGKAHSKKGLSIKHVPTLKNKDSKLNDDDFADQFPITYEKIDPRLEKDDFKDIKDFKDLETEGGYSRTGTEALNKTHLNTSFNTEQLRYIADTERDETETWEPSLSHNQDERVFHIKKDQAHETSSVRDSSNLGTRVVKTLHAVFGREKVRPVTKIAIFVVYFSMLVVLALGAIDYSFARDSINQIKGGTGVLDLASKRLFYNILCWQKITILFSSFGSNSLILYLQNSLYGETVSMLQANDNLMTALQSLGEERIVDIFFSNSITMYLPKTLKVFNNEKINSFTASAVLGVKNLYVSNLTTVPRSQLGARLKASPETMFSLNNTANDYLVYSEQEIADSQNVLQDIINRNFDLLKLILAFENLSLILVGISLFVVVRVIAASYKRMFNAVVHIHINSVQSRFERLENFKQLVSQDIELKKFTHDICKYLEHLEKEGSKPHVKPSPHVRFSDDRLIMRGLFIKMLKYLAFSIFLLICLSGMFAFSYATANSAFNDIQSTSMKLSVTHKLGYQIDNILSNTAHVMTFFNRSDLLIRNSDPNTQLDLNLQVLADANMVLLDTLSDGTLDFKDQVIETFLRKDMCTYLTDPTQNRYCISSTKDVRGLLSLNAKFLTQARYYIDIFRRNITTANGVACFNNLTSVTSTTVLTLQAAYEFLTDRISDQFYNQIETQKTYRLMLFISVMLVVFVSGVVINGFTIRKFKVIDKVLRRTLKIIPYEMIKENKMFAFFLVHEFERELSGIKQHL